MFEVCVIGCGQIGIEVVKELVKKFGSDKVAGVDVTQDACENLEKLGVKYHIPRQMPDAKVYIISLWTMQSIIDTARELDKKNPELILIESTIDPNYHADISIAFDKHLDKVVLFPHRFNPNDPEHHIFNQPRVLAEMATGSDSLNYAWRWLVNNDLMRPSHIITTDEVDVAIMSKVVENAYRAMEIIIAQELKQFCDDNFVDFEELRRVCNTKWNIDIREVRDGVRGKCLPKDLAFFTKYHKSGMLFRLAEMLNEQFIKSCDSGK